MSNFERRIYLGDCDVDVPILPAILILLLVVALVVALVLFLVHCTAL